MSRIDLLRTDQRNGHFEQLLYLFFSTPPTSFTWENGRRNEPSDTDSTYFERTKQQSTYRAKLSRILYIAPIPLYTLLSFPQSYQITYLTSLLFVLYFFCCFCTPKFSFGLPLRCKVVARVIIFYFQIVAAPT